MRDQKQLIFKIKIVDKLLFY